LVAALLDEVDEELVSFRKVFEELFDNPIGTGSRRQGFDTQNRYPEGSLLLRGF